MEFDVAPVEAVATGEVIWQARRAAEANAVAEKVEGAGETGSEVSPDSEWVFAEQSRVRNLLMSRPFTAAFFRSASQIRKGRKLAV